MRNHLVYSHFIIRGRDLDWSLHWNVTSWGVEPRGFDVTCLTSLRLGNRVERDSGDS